MICMFVSLILNVKYLMIDILPKTGLQWFTLNHFKSPPSIGFPFSPQDEGILQVPAMEIMCKFILMRHEENFDALFQ